jgi:sulfite reductase (NADPH) flavoprotein alpha-component
MTTLIPETAPFSPEQRAWLNGFFSGLLSTLDPGQVNASALAVGAGGLISKDAGCDSGGGAGDTDDFPWHDPALPIVERMELAKGRPIELRMMAAMAQLDCGACGYVCKTYSQAVAAGTEKNLTLCSPGGSETVKLLKQLRKEFVSENSESAASSKTTGGPQSPIKTTAVPVTAGSQELNNGTRENPVAAKLLSATKLNRPGANKDTRHVVIDLSKTKLTYKAGDALGIFPVNCPQLVSQVIDACGYERDTLVRFGGVEKTLFQSLSHDVCLRQITPELVERMQSTSESIHDLLSDFAESDEMDEWDVLEFLTAFRPIGLRPADLVETLAALRPRLYSIASSQSRHAEQVHLTVGRVANELRGRVRKGVASTMFADRLEADEQVRVFVHPSHGFTIPADSSAPMIMVGPGTGIAPFMAFLQQREHDRASGKNWLFFGDQYSATDFLYQEELEGWQRSGLLTHLDLAFSRDSAEKVYVQHRMLAAGAELFKWLECGAHFYVCGDASRMAVDVDRTLRQIISTYGRLTEDETRAYVANMVQSKRYVRDVY